MKNIVSIDLIRAREVVRTLVSRNPIFYILIVFYFQKKRVENIFVTGQDLLTELTTRYPYEAIAYQTKLENQYNPFPSSLNINRSSIGLVLSSWSTNAWKRMDCAVSTGCLEDASPKPAETELSIMHMLLDAVRTLELLDLYISLTISLFSFYAIFALVIL